MTSRHPGSSPVLLRRAAVGLVALLGLLVGGCAPTTTTAPAAAPSPSSSAPSSGPVTVPLTLEGATPRLVAHVVIGRADLRVVVDSGSTGLRVPASKVPAAAATVDGPAGPYGYASGLLLHGRLAHATVQLGSASSPAVPLELVDTTGCTPARPQCDSGDRTPDLMGGRYDGILGISPAGGQGLANPLWSFGATDHAYALHVDPAGASSLVLGASSDGFVLTRLAPARAATDDPGGPPRWQARIPICVRAVVVPGGSVCLPTLLDTGTPPLANIYPRGAAPASAPPGSPITFSTPDGGWTTTALAEPGEGANIPRSALPQDAGTAIAGLPLFTHTDVRFDLAAGTIGLRAR